MAQQKPDHPAEHDHRCQDEQSKQHHAAVLHRLHQHHHHTPQTEEQKCHHGHQCRDCAGIAVAAQQRRQYCRKTAEQKKPNQDELYPAVCTHVASFSNLALRRLTGRGLLLPTPIAKNRNTIWYS